MQGVFEFNIIQVLVLAPLMQSALKGLTQELSQDARKYLPPPDLIQEYNNSTLRFIRSNYEIMVAAWTVRLVEKVLPKYNVPVVNAEDSIDKIGVDTHLNLSLPNFLITYCQIVKTIVANIPLGLANEDKFYRQERLEDLFDCTLKLITTLNNNLDLKRFVGGDVVSTLQLLFNQTHSGDMFTEDMYLRVKSEKHYGLLFDLKAIKG
jgi:hypothetical protein